MFLQTVVDTHSDGFALKHKEKVLLLGSCFAENIGKRLQDHVFNVSCNPFGVLYNPASIAKKLELLQACFRNGVDGELFQVFNAEGLWRSWNFGTAYASENRCEALGRMRHSVSTVLRNHWPPDVLIITFGTNRAYLTVQDNAPETRLERVVANCHKQPDKAFEVWDMGVGEIIDAMKKAFDALFELNGHMRIIVTVSPYRYAKYGYHGNQISKSTLLLAVDGLQKMYDKQRIFYFPAYELLMDELRDYRFYMDDMLHPSQTALDIIWERFVEDWVSLESRKFIADWETCLRMMRHRPLHRSSEAYRLFQMKMEKRILDIQGNNPQLPVLECAKRLREEYNNHRDNEIFN